MSNKTAVEVIDMFSGCGGLSYGFKRAGASDAYRVLGGIDVDTHANETYRRVIAAPAIKLDISKLLQEEERAHLLDQLDRTRSLPLVVIGGPPCQGFSAHRKKDPRSDQRNSLIEVYAKIAAALEPEFIVLENVPELFDAKHWDHFARARDYLEDHGYRVRARLHNLADFGVPQARYRALIIARRAGRPFSMPKPGSDAHRTVRDAIGGLPRLAAGETDPNDSMHAAPKHTERVLRLIASVPLDGGSRRDADLELLPECHSRVNGFRDVYGRLAWDKPSISITTKSSTPSCGRFLHPEQDRNISVREAALLQGFPPDYYFCGPFVQKYRQIGNAVPPLFARALAEHLLSQFDVTTADDDPADDVLGPMSKSFTSAIAGLKKIGRTDSGTRPAVAVRRDKTPLLWQPTTGSRAMIDCFCGAGGLSYGLHAAGFRSVYAFDTDDYAVRTYRNNVAACVERTGAEEITAEYVLARTGLSPGECVLVAGGPPCQGFSQQRRGPDDDPRNSLVLWYGKFIAGIRPLFFVLENVTYLTSKRGRDILAQFRQELIGAGYSLHQAELDASDFGVAQKRRRIIVVGHKAYPHLMFEFPGRADRNVRTVRDAIGDLPSPPHDGDTEHPDYANHKKAKITAINELRISHVPPGGGWQDIPVELQLPCHQRHRGQGHIDVYGRLSWDGQARTITALCDNFSRGQFAHPVEDRAITAREAAALQSFPNSYRFWGPKKDVARQIGNAVPPRLAEAVGRAILRALQIWDEAGCCSHLPVDSVGDVCHELNLFQESYVGPVPGAVEPVNTGTIA